LNSTVKDKRLLELGLVVQSEDEEEQDKRKQRLADKIRREARL
jgi:hypothetical protein